MFELETDASASYRRARRRLSNISNSEESRVTCSGRSGDDVAFGTGIGLGIDGRLSTRGTSSHTESGESGSAHGEEGQADAESEVPESGVRVMGSPLYSLDSFLKVSRGKRQFYYALDSKTEWGSDRMRLTTRSSIFSRRDRRRDHGGSRVGEGDERSRGNRNLGSGAANGSGSGTRYRKMRGFCPSGESGADSDDSGSGCLGSGNSGTSSRSTRFGNTIGVRGYLYGRYSVHKKVGRAGAALDDDDREEEYGNSDAESVVGARSARASYTNGTLGGGRGVPDGRGELGGGVRESSNRGQGGGGWGDYVKERQGLKGVYGDEEDEEVDGDELESSRDKRTLRHQRRQKLRSLGHHSSGGFGGLCAFHGSVYSPAGWNASLSSGDVGRVGSGSVGRCGGGDDVVGAHFVGGRNYGAQQHGVHCRVCTEIGKRARKTGTGLGRKNEEQDRSGV